MRDTAGEERPNSSVTWSATGGRPARIYLHQLCVDTRYSLPEAVNDRDRWRERVKDICAVNVSWWWWWWWWWYIMIAASYHKTTILPIEIFVLHSNILQITQQVSLFPTDCSRIWNPYNSELEYVSRAGGGFMCLTTKKFADLLVYIRGSFNKKGEFFEKRKIRF